MRLGVVCALVPVCAMVAPASAQDVPPEPPPEPDYAFVSMPDFLNADVADVSYLPTWDGSQPNGTSPAWERAIGNVLDAVQREGVRHLYVAGDLVEGEWGRDSENSGIFGPVDTRVDRRRAVMRAASVYYRQTVRRFAERGLALYPAVGDHEIGDNPWGLGRGWYAEFKYRNLGLFKHAYSRYIMQRPNGTHRFRNRPPGQANGTAYAVRPHPDVQLISLDVFRRGVRRGQHTVRTSIDRQQFDWMDRVLTKANEDGVGTIIVQAHTPILGPVRKRHSSGLMYELGWGAPLWRLMVRHGVDLYLAGEMHDVTASQRDGIVQIVHGGLMKTGDANYIVVRITGSTIAIESKAFPAARPTLGSRRVLWQTNMLQHVVRADPSYPREPVTTGRMVLTNDDTPPSEASGALAFDYPPPPEPEPEPESPAEPDPVGA